MKTTKRHMWWARLSIAALLGVTLIAAGEVWSATHSQRRGGRGGGGHHRMHSAPRHHGSVRPHGRGSVRHHRPSAHRSRPAPGRTGSRHHAAHRPSSRHGARNPIQRTPGHGSIRNRANVNRSFTDRRRHAARAEARSLRDLGPGPDRIDRRDRIRRRALRRSARRYRWGDYSYWYDYGYWWQPSYYGDEQWYVQTYPPAGLAVDELPEDAVPVEGEEGLYEANGVYYQEQADGTYAIVEAPDSGMPDPVTIARRALDFLGEQSAFTLTATDTIDHVQDDGQKIQSETRRVFHLRRPDALATTAKGDDVDRLFWYDGRQMTIVDRRDKVAAQTAAPGTIDEMIDFAVSQLSVSLPLIDFLYSDPFAGLAEAMGDGEYLGLIDIDGVPCHHLSFSAGDADWQLWVDSGEQPVPVMMAITYMSAPETPTYRARFERWEMDPEFADDTFAASIPDGIEKIPFTTPKSEVRRIEDELDQLREDNQRVADHIASQRTIVLFSRIANKPAAQARVDAEKARLEEIGEVSREEIDAYEKRRKELRRELDAARGHAARSER